MFQRASLEKAIVVLLSAIAVIFAGFTVPRATAQDNFANITIDKVTVEKSQQHGTEVPELRRWEFGKFNIEWSAPTGVKEGQKFTVRYPDGFHVYLAENFPLVDKDKVRGGTCVVDPDQGQITCTFDKTFVDRENVKGTLTTEVQARKEKNTDEVEATLNAGIKIKIDLPGTRGIIEPNLRMRREFYKQGWYEDDFTKARWTINFPGTIAPDATIDFQDTLGGEIQHTFFDPTVKGARESLRVLEYKCQPDSNDQFCVIQEEDTPNAQIKDITDRVRNARIDADRSLKFEIEKPEGGWKADHYYRVIYYSQTATGKPAPIGSDDTNITTNNVESRIFAKKSDQHIYRTQRSSGTISGVIVHKGSFQLTKKAAPGLSVPAGTMFEVKATYSNPGRKINESEVVKVAVDGTVSGSKELPAGTIVTLEEINLDKIPGVSFAEPVFASASPADNVEILDNGKKARFAIKGETNVAISLLNSPAVTETPSTSPSTTPSTTPPVPPTVPPTPTTTPTTPESTTPTTPESTTPTTPESTTPTTPPTQPPAAEGSSNRNLWWIALVVPILAGMVYVIYNVIKRVIPGAPVPPQGQEPVAPAQPNPKAIPKK
ncbi:hypothetical protein CMUST_06460 [Corynebacterium mustelae]|uniref:SDR-like Ig domain-containing protein n=1 Tax=Corynebacterium mustelae TaxID=571915 RepID=A0A0G3H3H5_9CORY|nr:Ig-like domain-containing protein [Corynebacterium mustelae]AKK05627.1 hypothetical protein CMUST_06460 [Corynebacterium mustelae]